MVHKEHFILQNTKRYIKDSLAEEHDNMIQIYKLILIASIGSGMI